MLFEQRFWAGIADGAVTTTFRRWRRVQARAGRRQRTAAGIIEIDAVDVVTTDDITSADVVAAGYPDVASLVADLRGTADLPIYRIRFHLVPGPDPRAELAAADRLTGADLDAIATRLRRLDQASPHGPWTADVLALIAANPGVRAGDLADRLGRDLDSFKQDVRKLKNLGLTLSLQVGYRISPRGTAYLASRR